MQEWMQCTGMEQFTKRRKEPKQQVRGVGTGTVHELCYIQVKYFSDQ